LTEVWGEHVVHIFRVIEQAKQEISVEQAEKRGLTELDGVICQKKKPFKVLGRFDCIV
jgi:hypothetical protein